MPASLLKDCLKNVAPFASAVVNTSITEGVFPDDLKEALVKPPFKKANMDPLDKNYCPVSNLPFIGKLIERVVVDQLSAHGQSNEQMEPLQSAYRPNHSTDTALLKVKGDIHRTLNNKEVVCWCYLTCQQHLILWITRFYWIDLKKRFGNPDTALKWVESYLHQHIERVVVEDPNTDGSR